MKWFSRMCDTLGSLEVNLCTCAKLSFPKLSLLQKLGMRGNKQQRAIAGRKATLVSGLFHSYLKKPAFSIDKSNENCHSRSYCKASYKRNIVVSGMLMIVQELEPQVVNIKPRRYCGFHKL